MSNLINYTLHLADNSLILGQRNSEWCGHGPVLEQDIAITNISLDLIGQARNFYQYAATIIGNGATEDSLAYLRKEREFRNCLLVEQPNNDWAQTILRQFFFSQYQYLLFQQLQNSKVGQLAAIAEKSLKEVTYHLRWSSEWVIRLGDGTDESHKRIKKAFGELWMFTGEMFVPSSYELVDTGNLKGNWEQKVKEIFDEALLLSTIEDDLGVKFQKGGKEGKHTEHLGYILSDMQYLQRAHPNSQWYFPDFLFCSYINICLFF